MLSFPSRDCTAWYYRIPFILYLTLSFCSCFSCCVCDHCHDNHLMVQCDTCSKFYHIGCLTPPLLRVPKKTSCYGWQCEDCCCDSEDELKDVQTKNDGPRSRSGRRLHKTAKTNRDLEQVSVCQLPWPPTAPQPFLLSLSIKQPLLFPPGLAQA